MESKCILVVAMPGNFDPTVKDLDVIAKRIRKQADEIGVVVLPPGCTAMAMAAPDAVEVKPS